MNMNETQADGLRKMFNAFFPAIEHNAKVCATKPPSLIAEQVNDLPLPDQLDIWRMLKQANATAMAQLRKDDVTDALAVVSGASLVECKQVVDALIERVSSLVGVARELEDAALVLGNEIIADE